jgi:hypothetical protein
MISTADRSAVSAPLIAGCNLDSSQTLTTAGLVIGGTTTLVKTGAAITYLVANGLLVAIGAATNMPVLVGTVVNATFNVFCFFSDQSGNLVTSIGTPGATLGAVKFPQIPVGQTMLGFVIINPTGTGNFVGGTTALGDATVVPGAVYISPNGAFDPSVIIG